MKNQKNPRRSSLLIVATLLSLTGLVACATQSRRIPADQPIRMMQSLPQGIQCQALGNLRTRDGTGCANMGSARAGNEQTLFYNLKAQARLRGANLVIAGEPQPDSWSGCPSNGLMVEAQLYSCDF